MGETGREDIHINEKDLIQVGRDFAQSLYISFSAKMMQKRIYGGDQTKNKVIQLK